MADILPAKCRHLNDRIISGLVMRLMISLILGLSFNGGQIISNAQTALLRDGLRSFELQQLQTAYHMVQLLYFQECACLL